MNAGLTYAFIFVSGILQAFGNSMNSQLKNSLGNPWLASIVSFALIVAVFILLFAVFPRPLPTVAGVGSMPWWAPLGGITGAVAVFAGLTLVEKIGAGPMNGLLITANIIASIAIDHFGLFNMPTHAASPGRLIGGFLMVAGITLISVF